jgi:hypothetical protein
MEMIHVMRQLLSISPAVGKSMQGQHPHAQHVAKTAIAIPAQKIIYTNKTLVVATRTEHVSMM